MIERGETDLEALGCQSQVEDEIQDLVIESAVQTNTVDPCSPFSQSTQTPQDYKTRIMLLLEGSHDANGK